MKIPLYKYGVKVEKEKDDPVRPIGTCTIKYLISPVQLFLIKVINIPMYMYKQTKLSHY